jgi:hypothetical protein
MSGVPWKKREIYPSRQDKKKKWPDYSGFTLSILHFFSAAPVAPSPRSLRLNRGISLYLAESMVLEKTFNDLPCGYVFMPSAHNAPVLIQPRHIDPAKNRNCPCFYRYGRNEGAENAASVEVIHKVSLDFLPSCFAGMIFISSPFTSTT